MKTLLHKWRALQVAAAIAALTLAAHSAPEVQTLGGGPNQAGPGRAGANNGDTFNVAKFNDPYAVAVDANGNLYIADRANNKIRKVTNPGAGASLTSTFASRLPSPVGVAVGSSNQIYVVTLGDGKLRVFNSSGNVVRTVTGLRKPTALTLGANGNVYVTEMVGNVQVIGPNDTTPHLIASGFLRPQGIALLTSGLLAVSDTGHHAVYTVNPIDGTTTLVAGNNGAGFTDGPGATAQFKKPMGLGAAPNGSLVIADRGNHRVRVLTSNTVSTLYGVSPSQWVGPFPGWVDGEGGVNGVAAAHDPVGVAVAFGGTVYTTEIYWNLLRQVTDTGLQGTTGTGIATNEVVIGTNTITVVGTNIISFGFASGEVSSEFVGAAGQHFYAPVTLSVAPGQTVYSFQMSLSATGETGVILNPAESDFVPMLMKPVGNVYTPIYPNYTFLNSSLNLMGVGWFERYQQTNLYNTLAHHLIKYSIAKDTLFDSSTGKAVLGAYRVVIPPTATASDSFRIAINNPSGTADGVAAPLQLRVPTDGSLGAGALNTIKRVTLASRLYLVGDSAPFRWYNAGDFGNNALANNDAMEVFQTAAYGFNGPIGDSDLKDAMDASDGMRFFYGFNSQCPVGDPLCDGNDTTINSITTGDGLLNVDDVWVTFRRSLDPSLKWFARYWSNGVRQVVEVTNSLSTGFGTPAAATLVGKSTAPSKSLVHPTVVVTVNDYMPVADETVQLPVRIRVEDGYVARVMMLNLTVQALDGSPAITTPIQFQTTPAFDNPELRDSHGPNNYAAAWLDTTAPGVAGDSLLALLTVHIPANAGPNAAYRVHFEHFSASPNGTGLFDSRTQTALLLLSDRTASTWEDGISDAWRLRYFGSISAPESTAGVDADADGVSNADEYTNGTDPTDPLSH